jgi:hypothetical protein
MASVYLFQLQISIFQGRSYEVVPQLYMLSVGNTKTTERGGGESVVYELKQFYTF